MRALFIAAISILLGSCTQAYGIRQTVEQGTLVFYVTERGWSGTYVDASDACVRYVRVIDDVTNAAQWEMEFGARECLPSRIAYGQAVADAVTTTPPATLRPGTAYRIFVSISGGVAVAPFTL